MKIKKICYISLLMMGLSIGNLFAITHDELAYKMMTNNPSLQNSKKDIELAALDLKDAKAAYYPQIDFLSTATYMANPYIDKIVIYTEDYIDGQTGTSGTLSSLSSLGLDGPITVYDGMENTYYDFGITITQPIYTWGKINTSVDLYNKVIDIKTIKSNSLYKQLLCELETREAAIYYLKQMKANLLEQAEIANELINMVNDAYDNHMVIEQDVLEAKIQAKQIDIGLKEIEKEENTQLSQITKLTNIKNITSDDIEYVVNEDIINSLLLKPKESLIAQSLNSKRDTIQMLTLLNSVQEDQVKIAKESIYYKPDLALQISTNYSGYRFPFVETGYYTSDEAYANFTIAITTTLWDGGKKLNDIARKTINEEKSLEDLTNARNEITQKLSENLYNIELTTSKIEYEELNSQIIQSKIINLNQEYEQGFGDKASILKEELKLKASEIEIYKELIERAQSYYTIMYLIS
ncbi:MAG: TolC family protein [Pleomorphochaeta sp.]